MRGDRKRRATLLLADDHAVVVEGLQRMLESKFEVLGAAKDGRELLAMARRQMPDVVVLDVSMPGLNGLEAARQLGKLPGRPPKIVFLTANNDLGVALQAFRAGATGYVLKSAAADELALAIRDALCGRRFVSSKIAADVLQNLMEGAGRAKTPLEELTPREREILQLLAEGASIKEAAAVLQISPRTVEFHKENIQRKTGLKTTAELARFAARYGVVAD